MRITIKKLLALMLFFLSFACSNDKRYFNHTHILISQTIDKFHWGHRPPYIPQYIDTSTNDSLLVIRDSILNSHYKSIDSVPTCIILVDSLFNYRYEKYENPTHFNKGNISLADFKLDLGKINNNQLVIINKLYDKARQLGCNYKNSIGTISYSIIHFNNNYTLAEFIVYFDCGTLCGSGWKVQAKKEDNIWVLIQKELIAIS